MMNSRKSLDLRVFLIAGAILLGLLGGSSMLVKELPSAYGGMFGPINQQAAGRYQISACDSKAAWVIDTAVGDVFLIYATGKWKDVGSILDERTRIKKE
jgi:hypothetical protein